MLTHDLFVFILRLLLRNDLFLNCRRRRKSLIRWT